MSTTKILMNIHFTSRRPFSYNPCCHDVRGLQVTLMSVYTFFKHSFKTLSSRGPGLHHGRRAASLQCRNLQQPLQGGRVSQQ